MKKAFTYGILSSLFFAFTFIFNRSMNLTGGYWLWSATLRYLFTLPFMAIIVWKKGEMAEILQEIKNNLWKWLFWSTIGFGVFYVALLMASTYGESWFAAASWQLVIVTGVLLSPLTGHKIPVKNLFMSAVILVGIALLQLGHSMEGHPADIWKTLILVLIAAFAYPCGNRKMMQHCGERISTNQRVFGMTLCSMPFYFVMSGISLVNFGPPSAGQCLKSLIVAFFAGVVATILFFEATNMVKHNPKQLAVVEATQSCEVIFTLVLGVAFLGDSIPTLWGFIGLVVIMAGMIGNSLVSAK